MKFAIGTTRAGLTLKKEVIKYLEELGHEINDLGMKEDGEFVPYYEAAANVARAVSNGEYEKAIIICGTGAGSVIVANKFKGVHAVHATDEYSAGKAKIINDANVLVLAEWMTPPQHANEMIKVWLDAEFGQGFAPEWVEFLQTGVDEVKNIEDQNMN
jgi:ribose 5-phosphate isomerase B